MAKALLFPEGDIAINSPRHVIIDILDRALNGIVWSRLPEADSELTGKDHFVAVTKVSDTLSGRACCNTAYRNGGGCPALRTQRLRSTGIL